jgi:cytochrome c oxidase cbb3-type subunit III
MTPSPLTTRANAALLAIATSAALLVPLTLAATRWQRPSPAQPLTPNASAGKPLFERHCAFCHGIDGGGGRGPRLNRLHLTHAADDAALRSVISEGLAPAMPDAWFLNDEEVANVAAYVRSLGTLPPEKLPGNPTRGALVYAKSACATCHILAGDGVGFGPDLSDIGERRSTSLIRQAILKPATALPENFLFVKAVTSSGQIIQGLRVNEDTFSIQIKDANGRSHSFRKQELKELQKTRSETPMPSFDGVLGPAEIDDLIAYLAASRAKP